MSITYNGMSKYFTCIFTLRNKNKQMIIAVVYFTYDKLSNARNTIIKTAAAATFDVSGIDN